MSVYFPTQVVRRVPRANPIPSTLERREREISWAKISWTEQLSILHNSQKMLTLLWYEGIIVTLGAGPELLDGGALVRTSKQDCLDTFHDYLSEVLPHQHFVVAGPQLPEACWTSDNFQTLHENAARHRIHEIKSAWASWLIFVPNFQCTMGKLVTFAIKSNKRVNIEQSDGRQIFAILSSDSLQYQGHILSFKARSSDVFNLWIICESVNVKAKYSHSNSQCYTSAGGGKWGASWRNQECGYLGEYSSRIFWRNLECGFKNCG